MPAQAQLVSDPSVEVILAYASTGLGHLRVTNALFEAAPHGVIPHLLRTKDPTASHLHRLTSIHPLTRAFLEWSQNGLPEEVFTRSYRYFLRHSYRGIENELSTLIEQEFNIVKTVVIVATHFGLAHQIAGAKAELSRKLGVKIILVVCVTDDSPQKVWYVEGADCIIVPSDETKNALELYGTQKALRKIKFEVVPYPISQRLNEPLTSKQLKNRIAQLDPFSKERIQVSVPVSGAAVNLDYLESLMTSLYRKNPRFYFYVISRDNMYTHAFLEKLSRRPYVSLITSKYDREIVKYYNDLVTSTVLSFEITKPSEQTFKVLLPQDRFGGVTLLFSKPVGRQEYDNLLFVKRNKMLDKRGFILSDEPKVAAESLNQKLLSGIFFNLMRKKSAKTELQHLQTLGAHIFWEVVQQLLT